MFDEILSKGVLEFSTLQGDCVGTIFYNVIQSYGSGDGAGSAGKISYVASKSDGYGSSSGSGLAFGKGDGKTPK